MKSDNRCLAEIIKKSLKYLSKYHEFKYLFIENKSASILFKYQFWDYKILLESNKKFIYRSIYSLSKKELKILQEYFVKNQKKEFIQFLTLSTEYSVLFILKSNREIYLYINY